MTTLSAADKAKQDAARENDGKFGTQLHGEPAGGTGILGGDTDFMEQVGALQARAGASAGNISALEDRLRETINAEQAWAASNTALAVLRDFPGAETIDYRSVLGKITVLNIRSGDEELGHYATAAATGISGIQTRSRGQQQFNTLFEVVNVLKTAGLETMEEQGATVEPHRPGEHIVTLNIKDVLQRAAGRLQQDEAFIPQDRKQHTAMVMAIESMPENVGSFRMVKDEDGMLRPEDIKDLDGNPVSEHVETEVQDVFWDSEDEYTAYIGQTVDVPETLAVWRQK